ncbi:hypothetical protein Q7P37_004957 [Cladosporium fusiforme]
MDYLRRLGRPENTSWISTQSPEQTRAMANILKAYPNNRMIKYVHAPASRHPTKVFLSLLIIIFSFLPTCWIWGSEETCFSQWDHFSNAIFLFLFFCMGHLGYLKYKVRKLQESSQHEVEGEEDKPAQAGSSC